MYGQCGYIRFAAKCSAARDREELMPAHDDTTRLPTPTYSIDEPVPYLSAGRPPLSGTNQIRSHFGSSLQIREAERQKTKSASPTIQLDPYGICVFDCPYGAGNPPMMDCDGYRIRGDSTKCTNNCTCPGNNKLPLWIFGNNKTIRTSSDDCRCIYRK